MSKPKHGTYEPGRGFYSAVVDGWVRDPAKIGESIPAPPPTLSQREQVEGWGNRASFKPDRNLEGLRRLRDSDKQEEREAYNKIAAGGRRMEMHDYEERRAAAIESGEFTPEAG